jgi:hypothetical protein
MASENLFSSDECADFSGHWVQLPEFEHDVSAKQQVLLGDMVERKSSAMQHRHEWWSITWFPSCLRG